MGTAVVNDATAAYYNPAALILLKTPQAIALDSIADFHNQFTGQAVQAVTGFTTSGTSRSSAQNNLPAFYAGYPAKKFTAGVAVVANDINTDIGEQDILRYVQSSNHIRDLDVVPAIGFKINECLALGMGLNFSRAHFLTEPITGLPALNIPDSQSRNSASGSALGADIGMLIRPASSTLIGINYRSLMTYRLSGSSSFNGTPSITANNFHFTFWTPARSVVSVNYFINQQFAVMGTVHYIQWDVFNHLNAYNIATQIGTASVIIPYANIPFHFRNTWLLTVGANYKVTPALVIRPAASYVQTPANPNYQISNGDSLVLGVSVGYKFNKHIMLDGGYAHAFFQNENIHTGGMFLVTGVNKSAGNVVSLKLTINV
jgi:long-subunit fatty acid transport protein